MIQLQNIYTLRGRKDWVYRLLKREGDVAIVEMHRTDMISKEVFDEDREWEDKDLTPASLVGYEVFVVQKYPERPRPDKKGMIPAKEMPPPDYYWGRYGESINGVGDKLARAMKIYDEYLIAQVERIAKREGKLSASEPQGKAIEENEETIAVVTKAKPKKTKRPV